MTGQHLLTTRNLQEKFRSLIPLTTLVAGINRGHPTLGNSSELPGQSLVAEESPIDVALKSLATLLVRDDNDITLAVYNLPLASASADSMHLVAMEGVRVNCIRVATKGSGENGQNCKGIDEGSELGSTMRGKPNDRSSHCVLVNDGATSHLSHIDTWRYNLNLW
jgi:hypothetical protein